MQDTFVHKIRFLGVIIDNKLKRNTEFKRNTKFYYHFNNIKGH